MCDSEFSLEITNYSIKICASNLWECLMTVQHLDVISIVLGTMFVPYPGFQILILPDCKIGSIISGVLISSRQFTQGCVKFILRTVLLFDRPVQSVIMERKWKLRSLDSSDIRRSSNVIPR